MSNNTDDAAELEELDTSGLFEAAWYLVQYPDVRIPDLEPLVHFYRYGWREHRRRTDISIPNGTSSNIRTCVPPA